MRNHIFCKGYTWGFFSTPGEMQTPQAEASMRRMAENGLDWICIPVNAWQETFASTTVFSLYGRTQTDADIVRAVEMARALGLKICLKPMVNCLDGAWRGCINFPGETANGYWERWFRSYTDFLLYYARMAEKLGCEMFCTGCEMGGMDRQADFCRAMIAEVRAVYSGIIMHNINHGEELRFSWLDAVDIIGISGYYAVTDAEHRGIDTMRKNWADAVKLLTRCHEKYGRPLMFAEIGVRSERGCTMQPWVGRSSPDAQADEQEQADFYESAMEVTWNLDWFCGYFWWDWKVTLPPESEAHRNLDYTVYGKRAEQILRKWYTEH